MYQIPVHESHPPVLTALQRLMAQAIALDEQIRGRVDWTKRILEQSQPSAWTSRIEGALDSEEKLEFLRAERREKLIEGESLLFGFHALGERLSNVQSELFGAIAAVVKQIDGIHRHGPDEWLKPMLINAVLQAEEIRRSRPTFSDDGIPNRHDADRDQISLAALKAAFDGVVAVVEGQRDLGFDNNSLVMSLQNLYPTVGAVSPAALGQPQVRRAEMRQCHAQPFIDTVNREHPALRRLSELLPALDAAVKAARDASSAMRKGEKGNVNERQYAARLITVLDRPGTCGSYSPASIKEEQKRQKRARLAYHSQRVLVYSELVAAEEVRRQVLAALREAIVECETLESELRNDARATTDKLFTRRLALINCIAADVQLRRAGCDLLAVHAEYVQDITAGKGENETAGEFADLKKYYDSFKPRESAATGGAEGGSE
jgi:hypothetical protein